VPLAIVLPEVAASASSPSTNSPEHLGDDVVVIASLVRCSPRARVAALADEIEHVRALKAEICARNEEKTRQAAEAAQAKILAGVPVPLAWRDRGLGGRDRPLGGVSRDRDPAAAPGASHR
jgi:hypothetical protein